MTILEPICFTPYCRTSTSEKSIQVDQGTTVHNRHAGEGCSKRGVRHGVHGHARIPRGVGCIDVVHGWQREGSCIKRGGLADNVDKVILSDRIVTSPFRWICIQPKTRKDIYIIFFVPTEGLADWKPILFLKYIHIYFCRNKYHQKTSVGAQWQGNRCRRRR